MPDTSPMRAVVSLGLAASLAALLGCGLFDEDPPPTPAQTQAKIESTCRKARECCVKLNTARGNETARCAEIDGGAKCAFLLELARKAAREAGVPCD